MTLFQTGNFTLASGAKSTWKIECAALTGKDWSGLAAIAAERLPKFGHALGVPRGGSPFAVAMHNLDPMRETNIETVLICEDVCTTGNSMERFKEEMKQSWYPNSKFIGVCVFARGPVPSWVIPLFTLTPARAES